MNLLKMLRFAFLVVITIFILLCIRMIAASMFKISMIVTTILIAIAIVAICGFIRNIIKKK